MKRVKICLPFYWDFETAKSGLRELKEKGIELDQWIYQYENIIWMVDPAKGHFPQQDGRNYLITNLAHLRNNFIKVEEYDYFLFIDSDIEWHIDDAVRLINHDKEIIGAPYVSHYEKDEFLCGKWLEPGTMGDRLPMGSKGLNKVDYTSAGMLLVKNEVFTPEDYPWFRSYIVINPKNGLKFQVGEDIGFCLGQTGKRDIWVDCDIELKHRDFPEVDWSF